MHDDASGYDDLHRLAVEVFGTGLTEHGEDIEITGDHLGDVLVIVDRHPDYDGGSYTPDEIRALHNGLYGDHPQGYSRL